MIFFANCNFIWLYLFDWKFLKCENSLKYIQRFYKFWSPFRAISIKLKRVTCPDWAILKIARNGENSLKYIQRFYKFWSPFRAISIKLKRVTCPDWAILKIARNGDTLI
jgi:hypothetical protein